MKKNIIVSFFIIILVLLNNKALSSDLLNDINDSLINLKEKSKKNYRNYAQYNNYRITNFDHLEENEELEDYNELNDELVSLSSTYATKLSNKFIKNIYKDSEIDLDFNVDNEGKIKGNSKLKLDLYKGNRSTFFVETNAKVKKNNKWVGNIGVGQKIAITKEWLFVYKTCIDYDFEEVNQKGNFSIELKHKKWLKITSNYYKALSNIMEYQDMSYSNDRFTDEWETDLETALPFYDKISFNATYTKIYNDNLRMVDSTYNDEYNLWSYGIEYEPIKNFKTFLKKKNTKNDDITTEIGLDFIYEFEIF